MNALVDINMFLIGILVTHYLFKAVNKINKFSQQGKLPSDNEQAYYRCFFIALVTSSFLILALFFVLNFYITNHYTDSHGTQIAKLEFYWGVTRAIGLILNIMQLICTIYKL